MCVCCCNCNTHRKDYWLTEGVTVKVVTKSLGKEFYKRKAVVERVVEKYAAEVKLCDDGVRLKLDQNHLETVIPAPGRVVKFVNGAYRGHIGVLKHVDTEKFCCEVEISEGLLMGRRVQAVQYEDISKYADRR